jgi:hypothetical protein
MRSGLAAGLMGIGGILASFGATIFIIAIFSKMNDWRVQLPTMLTVATATVVIGGTMLVLGYLVNRIGRGSRDTATA